ncbi:hypothetical protein AURDEDRAFT_112230 [Auricularia subglabra TFB-10046 SS5]|nr:hypothetical protein AURDEDRAFT_112230 [Auricularia subglabra TFB-10046 SS5]
MATIYDRFYAHTFAGLVNQTYGAVGIATFCVTVYEILRRQRRGRGIKRRPGDDPLGSVETWEFGYLYQGRCWAERPSPPLPRWPLAWVWQAIRFPEDKLLELVGTDATLYCRFLRGCLYFVLLHSATTLPTLLPIHIYYSPITISYSSLARGSIASLVQGGEKSERLLAVHVALTLWVAVTWICVLLWLCQGAFKFRETTIRAAAAEFALEDADAPPGPPPPTRGLRLRTIMVTNIPEELRDDKLLRDYFEYYLSHPHEPTGKTSSVPAVITLLVGRITWFFRTRGGRHHGSESDEEPPVIEKVVVMRKMTDLASLMERREDVLRKLETAHVALAKKVLLGVKSHLAAEGGENLILEPKPRAKSVFRRKKAMEEAINTETLDKAGMKTLVTTLAPFVDQFQLGRDSSHPEQTSAYATIWDALYSLPRSVLNPYHPLINLSSLFRGATVPSIDYYTAKLGLLTALVHEKRSRQHEEFEPASTAFVTFVSPADARRALEALPTHPRNPLECVASLAPDYEDLDWARVMKRALKAEFVTDWIVNLGVWAFTCSWIFPVSLFISLFNLHNFYMFIPGLERYMERHKQQELAISSLLPTVLVSLLVIFVPMLLLLIGKKAHTIITLSKLHDRIMTRYHKFLTCNVLIFFCVGVGAMQSFLTSSSENGNLVSIISVSFSTAGPFYVGWFIFQTAMHSGLELGLCESTGLPLLVYPGTKAATTLRRREVGTRPRTFNFYYWLPNHVLVVTITILFSCLTPLVIPFAVLYFAVEVVVIKNQLLHVYSKKYENDGKIILIRIVRYSLDGVMLAQVVLMAFMILQRKAPHAIVLGIFVLCTAIVKVYLTRRIRRHFIIADEFEAAVHCGMPARDEQPEDDPTEVKEEEVKDAREQDPEANIGVPMPTTRIVEHPSLQFLTWRLPRGMNFSYSSVPVQSNRTAAYRPNPFSQAAREQKVQAPDVAQWRQTVGPLQASQILDQEDPPISKSEREEQEREEPKAIVTAHPKKQPWDDRPRLDRPYVNPYYATPLDNFLWLPLNPFSVLDLDESADMHRALTSEPHAGKLGVWLNDAPTMAGNVISIASAAPSEMRTHGTVRRELSGHETIVGLPEAIERRARYEVDIEDSEGAQLTMGRGGTIRLRATPQVHTRHRRHQEEHERPKVFIEVDAGQTGGDSMISARDALLGEVLVEEQLATEERLRREQAEEQAQGSRLWKWTRG